MPLLRNLPLPFRIGSIRAFMGPATVLNFFKQAMYAEIR